jgi:hypothetical protein
MGRLLAALGGVVPQDPAEVLKVLGSLLRADPAEKARFVEDAHAAWVGGGWAIRGDSSPETRVILMTLEEATRRLAEQHRWVRPGAPKPRIRVDRENVWQSRIQVVRKAPKGEGVFKVGPNGLFDKALWAAAYRVQKGQEVILVAPPALEGVARTVARMIAHRAAQIDGGRLATVRTPYGEVRLLYGDNWEVPEAPEPRLLEAWKTLVAAEEAGWEEEVREVRDWPHQTRVDPALIRNFLEYEGEEVDIAYLLEDHSLVQEALGLLDEVVGDKEFNVYASPATVRRRDPWWKGFLGQVPTFGELKEAWENFLEVRGSGKKRKEVWRVNKMFRYFALLAAAEALIAEARDPESAVMEAVEEALEEAKRMRRKEGWDKLNPLLFLAPVIRCKVAEFRVREFGVTRISRDEARAVSRYFRLRAKGVEPGKAAKKAGLPTYLLEAIEGGEGGYALSTEFLKDFGFEPGEEPDYDTILLRAKVRELLEEVGLIWGEKGVLFVEHLLSGREVPAAQTLTPGLTPDQAGEIVGYLRQELEGWAEA